MKITAAERTKEWRKNNPEKVKAYREKTKERSKKLSKTYRKNNLDKVKTLQKKWYDENKEERKKHQRDYSKKYPEKIKKSQKDYAKIHPEKRGENHDNVNFNGLRRVTLKRDGYKCVECGITQEEHLKKHKCDLIVHHIDGEGRYSKKPNNNENNLQTLCKRCHSSIHGKVNKKRRKVPL